MRSGGGVIVPVITDPARHPRTFLGSETAPDDGQIRRRLTEIHDASQRRKSYATWAAAAGTLLAVVLTQQTGHTP